MLSVALPVQYCWGISCRDTTRAVYTQDQLTLAQHHTNPVIQLTDPRQHGFSTLQVRKLLHCVSLHPGRHVLTCLLCFIISQRTHLYSVNSIKYLAGRCCCWQAATDETEMSGRIMTLPWAPIIPHSLQGQWRGHTFTCSATILRFHMDTVTVVFNGNWNSKFTKFLTVLVCTLKCPHLVRGH